MRRLNFCSSSRIACLASSVSASMYLANPSDTACNEVGEETGCSFAAAEYALPGLAHLKKAPAQFKWKRKRLK